MAWAAQIHRLSRRLDRLSSWALALALLGASVAIRVLLERWVEPLKFLTFYPAIAASALLCGWRQGTAVLVLSALVAWYFFFEPAGSFAMDASTIVSLVGFLMVGGFLVLLIAGMVDLIDRLENANRLQESLFRELQHRVANNLTIVVAILRNARRELHNREAAIEALTEAEDRIAAMAHMHRRLHNGTASAKGLEALLRNVLQDAFRDLPVKTRVSVPKDVGLSIDQITAIALLVNEAATNAAKHVFRKGEGTCFEVELARQPSGLLQLTMRDDGPGISPTSTIESEADSLGVGIMQAFARQLGGTLEVLAAPGTTLSVEFVGN